MANKPKTPTVISPKGIPVIKQRVTFKREQPPAHLDEETRKWMTRIQDNVDEATIGNRSDPEMHKVIIQQLYMTKGQVTTIRHALGEAFTGYSSTRSYAGSDPFTITEVSNNAGADPTVYLIAMSGCTGTYDVKVFGG